MSQKAYIGNLNNIAKTITNAYIGNQNNFAKTIIAGYIGDSNNIARLFYTIPSLSIYAILYTDGNFIFQSLPTVDTNKTLINIYSNFTNQEFEVEDVPWYQNLNNIKQAQFKSGIITNSTTRYFENAQNLTHINYSGLQINAITNMRDMCKYCRNLISAPICGNNVKSFAGTYMYCSNITGTPVFRETLDNMD